MQANAISNCHSNKRIHKIVIILAILLYPTFVFSTDSRTASEIAAEAAANTCNAKVNLVKDLQVRQFNLTPAGVSTNLYNLQREADKFAAEISILEGLKRINNDYKHFLQSALRVGNENINVARTLANYDSVLSELTSDVNYQKFTNMHVMNNFLNLLDEIPEGQITSLSSPEAQDPEELKSAIVTHLLTVCDNKEEGALGYNECQVISSNRGFDLEQNQTPLTNDPTYTLLDGFLNAYARDYNRDQGNWFRQQADGVSNPNRVEELRRVLTDGVDTTTLNPSFKQRMDTARSEATATIEQIRRCNTSVVINSEQTNTECRLLLTPNEQGITPAMAKIQAMIGPVSDLTRKNIPDELFNQIRGLQRKVQDIDDQGKENQLNAVAEHLQSKQTELLAQLNAHSQTYGKFNQLASILGDDPAEIQSKTQMLNGTFREIMGDEFCSAAGNNDCILEKADGTLNTNLLLSFLQQMDNEESAVAQKFRELESKKNRLGELNRQIASITGSQDYQDLEAMKSAMLLDAKTSCPQQEGDTQFFNPTALASCVDHLNPGHRNQNLVQLTNNLSVISSTALADSNYSAANQACQSMANSMHTRRASLTEEQRRDPANSFQGQFGNICNKIAELNRNHVSAVQQRAIASSTVDTHSERTSSGRVIHRFYDDEGEEIDQYVEPNNLAIFGVAAANTFKEQGASLILGGMYNKYTLPNTLNYQIDMGKREADQLAWNQAFYGSPYYIDYMMNPGDFAMFGPGLFYDPVTPGVSKQYGNAGFNFGAQ
ncbi:MAG: hypothetical protein GY909_03105 [Oligoflexia bacterium]|nr:hypothetical protein [Oligoflexia bacterium]